MKYLKTFFNKFNRNDIKVGDFVKVVNFDGLTENQLAYLKRYSKFRVLKITNRLGQNFDPSVDMIKYYDVGYRIPLKSRRFRKIESENSKKILFLQYDHGVHFYGEVDTNQYFRNLKTIKEVYTKILDEKIPDVIVDFYDYSDVYKISNDFYVGDYKITDYDFVFFGFMYKFTTLSKMIVEYVEKHKVPNIKYETYDFYHNKAYQFNLLEELGYPYIPSILTTNLNKNILKKIEEFGYPLIVKDPFKDRGEGVLKVKDQEELASFFRLNKKMVLIQKFIPNDGEYRVITFKNKVQLIARKDAIDDVNKKNIDDRKSKKGSLPANVIAMCEDVSKHMLSDILGLDIIQDSNTKKYYVIETNASPHYCMFSVVTGVSMPDIITDYIIDNMKK